MTEQNLSRQQRKQLMKEALKKGMSLPLPQTSLASSTPPVNYVTEERLSTVIQDLQKVLNYVRYLENKVALLTETLSRKEIMLKSDISETESLYVKRDEIKKIRVKELLTQDLTVLEYLEAIKESPALLGFQKLNIHPIKDLNLNPFEVAQVIKELHPNLTQDQYLELGRRWDLTSENFGYKKPESK